MLRIFLGSLFYLLHVTSGQQYIGYPGGVVNVFTKLPEYRQLAEESMRKYFNDKGDPGDHYVVDSVKRVSIQVVTGTIARIDFIISPVLGSTGHVLDCHSEIWFQLLANHKDINVDCKVKSDFLIGAPVENDPDDPKYRLLAEKSLHKYLNDSRNNQNYKVDSVDYATVQLLAGELYTLDFTISPQSGATGLTEYCHSEIYETSEMSDTKNITMNCIQNPPILVNREVLKSPKDHKYRKLAEESMAKHLIDTNNLKHYTVDSVYYVTEQIVDGLITTIDFMIYPGARTSCTRHCRSKIWQKASENLKEIREVICWRKVGRKVKRRYQDNNPKSPKVK